MSQADKRRQWVLSAVDQYEVPLLRYALRVVGDADLARDAVQHTFLKLCDESRSGAAVTGYTRERLAAWLFRVCRNRAVDHLRQQGRDDSLDAACCHGIDEVGTGREGDPADLSESRELSVCLRELVAQLPPAQREAIDLWCEGFTYRQIGEIVGRQEGHVRVLVHRGFARLREHPQVRGWLAEEPGPLMLER